jgi:hypothetical protein
VETVEPVEPGVMPGQAEAPARSLKGAGFMAAPGSGQERGKFADMKELAVPETVVLLERDYGGFPPGARDILQGGYE